MAARRVEAMSKETSDLLAASYAVPDLVVAVQEAVYNAIDARASHVTVVVEAAHASFTVVDDGDGIHPDAMFEHIFESKASSKSNESTRKYGSRGQYLAALGALAKEVELESRVENHWTSFCKVMQNGQIAFNARSKITKTTRGTWLRVHDIFWWLPVRKSELEAHGSARIRLAKQLSSFFQSISMIWPTLSIDVSFPDAKVARCVIPGAPSCEVRLRGVFGDILGSELEYMTLDVDGLPFTIRGYAGVVRHVSDGDAYMESASWRQARAYYQFVFLDNFWLEDFQRDCCKTINNTAIRLELGIPIFVLKISANCHEYELHSDEETRVVNLKRPDVLTQTLRKFVETLRTRVIEVDASIGAMASSVWEEERSNESAVYEQAFPVDTDPCDAQLATSFDEEEFGCSDNLSRSQELVNIVGSYAWSKAARTSCEDLGAEEEQNDERESCYYEVADSFQGDENVHYSYNPHARSIRSIHTHELMEAVAVRPMMIYEELPTRMIYEDTPVMYEEAYEDDDSADPYAQYHGCAHCGSCGRSQISPSFATESLQFEAYQQPMHHHPSGVLYEAYPLQTSDYDHGYGSAEHHTLSESVSAPHQASYYEGHGEYAECESGATLLAVTSCNDLTGQDVEECYETIPSRDLRAKTTAHLNQLCEFDQLFFGKSVPLGPPYSRQSGRRQERVCTRAVKTNSKTEQWASSRRVGVVDFADASLDPIDLKPEDPSRSYQTHTTSAEADHDASVEFQSDEGDISLGSDQLSEYFSLEKLAKVHPRSSGLAIARFASKRTALCGLAGATGVEDRSGDVHVRKLPSDLHDPSTKVITLDKAMLHHFKVIKQVDRKFILVKATLGSPIAQLDDNTENAENESTRTLLLCIDQHAADERVRLEQLEQQVFGHDGNERNVGVVDHEPPLVLALNDRERDTLSLFADEVRTWGFKVENADKPIVQLTQTPRIDTRVARADDLREYLQLLARSDAIVARRVVRPPVITRFLHSRACRSAIMFGDYLSFSQCEDIIEQLRHCKLPFQCAHGRPSIVPLVECM